MSFTIHPSIRRNYHLRKACPPLPETSPPMSLDIPLPILNPHHLPWYRTPPPTFGLSIPVVPTTWSLLTNPISLSIPLMSLVLELSKELLEMPPSPARATLASRLRTARG